MNNNQLTYGFVGAVLGGVAVWLLMTTVLQTNSTGIMDSKLGSQSTMRNADILDAHFIEQMIPHHEDAITMARLAEIKAKRSEVKQLSQNIIDSQGREITQMKGWYKDWFGKEVPTGEDVMGQHGMFGGSGMHMGMMGDASDITGLEQASDFDKVFVEEMIPHHQMAVMMASMLKNGTERPEMKKLADDIITTQTKEIDQMRQWLKSW